MTLLRPYPAYQNTNIQWLGEVPQHWSVLPNRALFREIIEKNHPDEPMLSVTIQRGVISQEELLKGTSKKDQSNLDRSSYKLVTPNDLAYNKMRAWQGAIGVSQLQGIVSPAYIVLRPCRGQAPRYLHYLYRTPAFATEAERWSYGITSDQWSLRPEDFKQIYSPLPPLDEQRAIVNFLDAMDARITRFIAARKKMIRLLEEKKQAVINQAVTKGLDPTVPMKDSGVEWLGEIPAHWEVRRLKDLAKVQTGLTLGKVYTEAELEDRPYLRVANVQAGYFNLDSINQVRVPSAEARRTELRSGDVLMTEGGDIDKLGRGAIWSGEISGCLHQNHIFAVRPNKQLLEPQYLVLLMASSIGRVYFETTAKQTTNLAATNSSTLRSFEFPLPRIDEQGAIVWSVDAETAEVDGMIERLQREIELMQEYRTRLISDVVTGKLDVRGVDLGELPEFEEVPNPDDGTDGVPVGTGVLHDDV